MAEIDFHLESPELLFGNDAAEDEAEAVFRSYAIHRPEIKNFLDTTKPLQVVRAYKGEGKSALLRLVENSLKGDVSLPIVLRTTGQAVSPSIDSDDSDRWVREWKRRILEFIASEIGAKLSVAFTDDAITLVEEAERNGFRTRSFVSTITDRLILGRNPVSRTRPPMANAEPLLKRWLEKGSQVWLFIDDLDQNFRNDPGSKLKIASCFIAVRQIFSQIPEIRIRLAIRPNTWSTIKPEFEALSHVEQYMVDLPWPDDTFLDLLARRVQAYLERNDEWANIAGGLPVSLSHKYDQLVALVFDNPVNWGGRKRPVHVVLHTLSRHRPRWLIELCKVSAIKAHEEGRIRITLDDVISQLDAFGQRRIQDMIAEFRPQCPEIEPLLVAFSGAPERYATDELFRTIESRVLQGVRPHIVGMTGKLTPRDIAQFLFQIGFLSARRDHSDGTYDHLAYADRPNLLRVTTNIDEGMSWEIHPVFRSTLRLKDIASKSELLRRERRKGR